MSSSSLTSPRRGVDLASPAGVLAYARDRQAVAERAEADLLVAALAWADAHPAESVWEGAGFRTPGSESVEPIAGAGCPVVAEFSIAEFGAALGMSSTAAKRLVGHAVELAHRLPRLWARVQDGGVASWRARRVAEATIHAHPALSPLAAGWVDGQVAPCAERIGLAQLDRTVAEAIRRFGPTCPVIVVDEDGFPADGSPAPVPDTRHVEIRDDQVSYAGTTWVEAEVDLADALDLAHAVSQVAGEYAALGSELGLDARRAKALGEIARRQTSLDLTGTPLGGAPGNQETPPVSREAGHDLQPTDRRRTPARALELHLHFTAHTTHDQGSDGSGDSGGLTIDHLGRLEEGQRLVLLDQVRSWCADSLTAVSITPVVDLNTEIATGGYRPTVRQVRAVQLRDGTCRFPWCSRPARRCQVDHVTAYDHTAEAEGRPQSGPTTTANLACLCTRHHRVKTHATGWTVTMPDPGTLEWTSPHGHRFRVDHTGTTEQSPQTQPSDPDPPPDHQRR